MPINFCYLCLVCLICCTNFLGCKAQAQSNTIPFTANNYYSFIQKQNNNILNANHLNAFFETLYQQRTEKNKIINIIHIGDSHLQADFLSAVVRENFHQYFNNAGRGLIFPYKVAHTNEPYNFSTSSNITWQSKRCVFPDNPMPIGISGITLQTNQNNACITIKPRNPNAEINYNFDEITLFYNKTNSFDFVIKNEYNNIVSTINAQENYFNDTADCTSTIMLNNAASNITICTQNNNSIYQNQATIYGISLKKSNSGVRYNTVAVNGAMYTHYFQAAYFTKQTAQLNPHLIIISLGTNESLGGSYSNETFFSQISSLVSALEQENIGVKILLTTPADCFKNRNKTNQRMSEVKKQIVQYAQQYGYAYWDLYEIAGGQGSALNWKLNHLLQADGVHFTREGYELQGNLLFEAITKAYNNYVTSQHP